MFSFVVLICCIPQSQNEIDAQDLESLYLFASKGTYLKAKRHFDGNITYCADMTSFERSVKSAFPDGNSRISQILDNGDQFQISGDF